MATRQELSRETESDGMPTRRLLMDSVDRLGVVEAYTQPADELLEMQLKAAQEVFEKRRQQISVLDRRAQDTGIDRIETLEDIVPLLFSHTTYKSYPMSYLTKGKWDKLLRWFSTLVAKPVDDVDLSNVTNTDEFVAALWEAGHYAVVTNGTSGKVSFLERTQADDAQLEKDLRQAFCWPDPPAAEQIRHGFQFTPNGGPYMMMVGAKTLNKLFVRPDSRHTLTDEPLSIGSVVTNAQRKTMMAEGTASPEEIRQWEEEAAERARHMEERSNELIEKMIELRREPQLIGGPWAQMWKMMHRARELGVADGEFHPETILACGGGTKGAPLPPDYRDQIMRFVGPVRTNFSYSMSEMAGQMYGCEAGNYHVNPWAIPILLDASGENLAPQEGVVEGRFGVLDLSFDARWGGVISGDKVTMDFTQACGCGRKGAVVRNNITRFSDLGEEDKIGCAGTIDGYIRGAMAD